MLNAFLCYLVVGESQLVVTWLVVFMSTLHQVTVTSQDFCFTGMLARNFASQTFRPAFGEMEFKDHELEKQNEDPDQATDPKLVEALSFHAVNGVRLRSTLRFLESSDSQWSVALLSIALETTRALTWHWLSGIGKSLKDDERPPLFKLIDQRTSIIAQALQFLSALCLNAEGSGRLLLLWSRYSSTRCLREFCQSTPDKCRNLRRVLMLTASWIFRRHHMYIRDENFQLLTLGDHSAEQEELDNFLALWDAKHHCCMPPGICKDLKLRGLTSKDLQDASYKTMFFWIVHTLQCSIADVESMHSQNRQFAGSAFSSVVSKFVNSESKRVSEEAKELQKLEQTQEDTGKESLSKSKTEGIDVRDRTQRSMNPKAMSALELFRKRFMCLQRTSGEIVNPCNKDLWIEVKEAFNSLPSQERQLYESMAAESTVQAAIDRARAKESRFRSISAPQSAASPQRKLCHQASNMEVVQYMEKRNGLHAQLLPLHELCEIILGGGLQELQTRVANAGSSRAAGLNALSTDSFPTGEASLEKLWRSHLASGITGKVFLRNSQSQTESIGQPMSQEDSFPSKVVRESFCGEQCRHYADRRRIGLRANTLDLFNFIVKQSFDCIQ